jgi:B12 binding domain
MRLVLVQPPIRDFYDTDVRLQPIGLCYLKAAVRRYLPEVEVIIRDYHHGGGRQTVALPDALADLAAFYPVPDRSPFSAFHPFYHFGHAFDAIERDLEQLQPDLIGISALFTAYHGEALEVARRAKCRRDVPVLLGGSHVSAVSGSHEVCW